MSENMKKFLEMASKDENLKNKLMELEKMEPAEAIRTGIALAKEHGIELSETDFVKDEIGSRLSDDELKAVAGGFNPVVVIRPEPTYPCTTYGIGE